MSNEPGKRADQKYNCGKWQATWWAEEAAPTAKWGGAQQERRSFNSYFVQTQVLNTPRSLPPWLHDESAHKQLYCKSSCPCQRCLFLISRVEFLEMENKKLGSKILHATNQLTVLERRLQNRQSPHFTEVPSRDGSTKVIRSGFQVLIFRASILILHHALPLPACLMQIPSLHNGSAFQTCERTLHMVDIACAGQALHVYPSTIFSCLMSVAHLILWFLSVHLSAMAHLLIVKKNVKTWVRVSTFKPFF